MGFDRFNLDTDANVCAAIGRIDGIEDDKPRILDPAIAILESGFQSVFENILMRRFVKIDGLRAREKFAPAQIVIEKQAEAQHPGRALSLIVRKNEPHWPNNVRC